ncbi:MAG TPA: ABC transporter substrate-binding protein [Stellaceae bacterium]|nr:ABC transporter substrate-binding protein [Stellaceae bacterium]
MKGWGAARLASVLVVAAALSPAADAESIKVGIGPVTAAGAVFLAQDKGYFAAEGLEAEAVSLDAAQSVAQGVVAGALDFGATAATAAAYNLAYKGGLKIIGGQGREVPGFRGSAMLASDKAWDAGLKSLKDLGNRTIGIVQIGGPVHYETVLMAEKHGVDVKTMRLVPLQGLSNLASAIAGGQVDGGVEVNTIALKLSDAGKAHILAWVGDETPWQNTLLLAATTTANDKRALVERFLRAYKKGARDYYDAFTGPDGKRKDGPTAAATLALIAKHLGQPAEQLKDGISYDDPDARLDVQDVLRQIAWFKAQNMLPADADGKAMIDMRYVEPLVTQ